MATNYCPRPQSISDNDNDVHHATGGNDSKYPFTDDVTVIWDTAILLKASVNSEKVDPHHLALALIYPGISDINELYLTKYQKMPTLEIPLIWRAMEGAGYPQATMVQVVKTLQEKCQNEMSSGNNMPSDTEDELRRLIVILSRRKNNNAILVGDAGVGKTAIAHALAIRIPDMGSLLSSTSCHGKMEMRVKAIMKEVADANDEGVPIILHIDDIHLIMTGRVTGGTGGIEFNETFTANGKLRCFGATTMSDYTRYMESDSALIRRFTLISVCEPSVLQTVSILRALKRSLEEYHLISITDSAIIEASELANRYIASRRLPDSAIDVMDEACSWKFNILLEVTSKNGSSSCQRRAPKIKGEYKLASDVYGKEKQARFKREKAYRQLEEILQRQAKTNSSKDIFSFQKLNEIFDILKRLQHDPSLAVSEPDEVTPEFIASIVSQQTRIPLQSASSADEHFDLRSKLNQEVINQKEAVDALCEAVNLLRVGLQDRQRPTAALLFVGPSGCGKTFVVEQLAKLLFKSNNRLLRINGSEYSNPMSIERLIGTPSCSQHSQAGILTECVKRKPFSVILIDHFELTCIEFRHKIQAVIDKGFLLDADGGPVDFRNCILVLTTTLSRGSANTSTLSEEDKKNILRSHSEFSFSDEILDRMDRIVFFNALSQRNIQTILERRTERVKELVKARGVRFEVERPALRYLAGKAYSKQNGAREIDRVIKREVMDRSPDLNNRRRDIRLVLSLDPEGSGLSIVQPRLV
ncbi:P-loop containing nucleoside triphosphate hydrolase protein [Cyathus striatus]|nr:P-loop containing nucleoside triphosphate hydrolase protein [Cyathus striatus]